MIDTQQLASKVTRLLDASDHDLQRALELACAEILALQRLAGAGIRRNSPAHLDLDAVPRLTWSRVTATGPDAHS
ncbi:hypothetical protein [Labrys sp. 22185]|uniref:hypothetical protein n=1 Tax=Labrys sp. 22185 TaxID=3453888 RepID=UPI003F84FEAF